MKMKKYLGLIIVICLSFFVVSCNRKPDNEINQIKFNDYVVKLAKTELENGNYKSDEYTEFLEKIQEFSVKLSEELYKDNKSDKNFTISPISIYMALAMTAEAASDSSREEILNALGITYDEMINFKNEHGTAHRLLCKMVRSWKNNVGVGIGGLLIDTLTHRFLSNHTEYDFVGKSEFDVLCRDFFEFLMNEKGHDHYQALGSGQDVKVKSPFWKKAKLAYEKADLAVNEENEKKRNDIWREIFGNQFPCISESIEENRDLTSNIYTDHEEFIENKYLVDIRYDLKIDCVITRNGFREALLSALLAKGSRISRIRSLDFTFHTDAPEPYEVKWKARNVGIEAEKRNCLRGEIINSNRKNFVRHEIAEFLGPHYMECYIIKDGIVIARDRIDVPID